jgi:hypothetical protein
MTTGFEAELPSGVVVVALNHPHDDWKTYPGMPALPEDYDEWELRLVPSQDLGLKGEPRGYNGFHLSFEVADIGNTLRPLPGRGKLAWGWG